MTFAPDGPPPPKVAATVTDLPHPELPAQPWFAKIDRKIWAGGVGGILAWALLAASSAWLHFDLAAYLQPYVTTFAAVFGIVPAPSAQGGLAILIGSGIAYFVPMAYRDVYARLNSAIIARAVLDPAKTDVSGPQIAAAVSIAKADAALQAAIKPGATP